MGNTVEGRFVLRDEFSAGLEHIKAGAMGLSKLGNLAGGAMNLLGGAAGVASVYKLGEELIELGRKGADVLEVRDNFETTASGVGKAGDAMLASMRTMTKGTIDNQALMQMGSKFMLNGLAGDMGKLGQLYQIADARADALGKNTREAFEAMGNALNTGRTASLVELGFDPGELEAGIDRYAAGLGKTKAALNETEQRQALLNAVLEAGKGQLQGAGDAALSDADKIARMDASIKNAKDTFSVFIAPFMGGVAERIAAGIEGWATATDSFSAAWKYLASLPVPEAINLILRGGMPAWAPGGGGGGGRGAGGTEPGSTALDLHNDPNSPWYKATTPGGASGADVAELMRFQNMQKRGDEATQHNLGVYKASVDEKERKDKEWADKLQQAGEDAYNKMRSKVEGILFSPSAVSAGEMFTARTGGSTPLHADETIRRLRAAIQNGSKEWQHLVPAEVRGMNQEMQNLWLQGQEEKFYAGGSPDMVNWEGFRQQYGAMLQGEQNKESLVQEAMKQLGPNANMGMVKQALGVSDMGDVGAQMATGFQDAVGNLNPAQMLASRFTADLATNKKMLQDASKAAWDLIIGSIGLADESPLDALAARVAPKVASINSWNGGATGSGANP